MSTPSNERGRFANRPQGTHRSKPAISALPVAVLAQWGGGIRRAGEGHRIQACPAATVCGVASQTLHIAWPRSHQRSAGGIKEPGAAQIIRHWIPYPVCRQPRRVVHVDGVVVAGVQPVAGRAHVRISGSQRCELPGVSVRIVAAVAILSFGATTYHVLGQVRVERLGANAGHRAVVATVAEGPQSTPCSYCPGPQIAPLRIVGLMTRQTGRTARRSQVVL